MTSEASVERYRAEFPTDAASVRAIRDQVTAVARKYIAEEATVQDIRLAVSEAATNSVVHGRAPAGAMLVVRVDTFDGEMCVVVADQGRGMLPRHDSPGLGLGLPIMTTVASRIHVVSPGVDGHTEVHMYFPLTAR